MSQAKTTPKAKKERKDSGAHSSERLKTVVRRLPHNLPEDIFWRSVHDWVTDDTVTWKAFYAGKAAKRNNKENTPSRAYIAFKSEEQLAVFSREYDGHLFRDQAGNETQAVVEYAPFQKVPTKVKKVDARIGTIAQDEDYLSFLESLKASEAAEAVSLDDLMAMNRPPSPPKTTPLLEALKAEKQANKDKEAILRNHAHYKEHAAQSRKEDGKRKVSAVAARGAETALPASGKKSRKQAGSTKGTAAPSAATTGTPSSISAPVQPPKPPKIAKRPKGAQIISATELATLSASASALTQAAIPSDSQAPSTGSSRRARPVVGLASRQFEAALTGAGVAGNRSRRGKGKDTTVPSTDAQDGHADDGKDNAKPTSQPTSVPDIVQRPSTPTGNPKPAPESTSPSQHRGGRGGRRGRGRGRGGARGS